MTRTFRTLIVVSAFLFATAAFASSITGTVTNKTINKPSAGDDVVLIRLQQGMQESTRTKTDSRGHFSLDVPDDGIHLVRVTHDKANYFRPAPAGTQTVDVEVYDAAAHVQGITGEADVMRIETDGNGLHVVENFFIKNDSNPPRTQFSDRPFEFWLPDGAQIEGSLALGPAAGDFPAMPVQSPAVPLGDKGHYTFLFPVRPGETRFQISYHLAYSGSIQLAPRHALQMDTVAIMLPKSMSFKPGAASNYIAVTEETTAQTYVARNVAPSQPLDFTLSGAGQLPRDQENPGPGNNSQADASAPNPSGDTRPGGGLGVPIDTPDPLSKYKWWIIGGLLLLFAGGAGFMLSRPAVPAGATVPAPAIAGQQLAPSRPQALLEALKEELFTLETEHLAGSLSEADYAAQKAALDVVLRRAIRRQN